MEKQKVKTSKVIKKVVIIASCAKRVREIPLLQLFWKLQVTTPTEYKISLNEQ